MKRILVTYASMTGSTSELPRQWVRRYGKSGLKVDIIPLDEVKSLESYDGVVVGAPMIMGWHRTALGFLKKYRDAFQHIPLAVFVMAMSLTQTDETRVDGVTVYVDERRRVLSNLQPQRWRLLPRAVAIDSDGCTTGISINT